MSNNLIFTIDRIKADSPPEKTDTSLYLEEYKKLIYILKSGCFLTYILEETQIKKECVLKPNFLSEKLKLVGYSIILSPFNVFRQNGKWTLIGLYEDGRLRFWDIENCKCYLISKNNDFCLIKKVVKMGPVLASRKRFFYILNTQKDLKSELVIYDVWTMKKVFFKVETDYQIVDVFIYKNDFYLLDVDQKIICVESDFLADPEYLKYDDVSIHENKIKEISEKLKKGVKTIFLPVRTTTRRFDSILTDKDYDLKNYKFFKFFDDFVIFFSKSSFLLLNVEEFLNSEDLNNFENYQKYIEKNYALNFFFKDFKLKNIFCQKFLDHFYIILINEENEVYYLSEDILKISWINREKIFDIKNIFKILKKEKKRIDLEVNLSLITKKMKNEITNIFFRDEGLFIITEKIEVYKFINKEEMNRLTNCILKNLAGDENNKNLDLKIHNIENLKNGENGLFLDLYNFFSTSLKNIYAYQDFYNFISKRVNDNDKIIYEFVCNFKNGCDSYYLVATNTGDILLFPLFFSAFSDFNDCEIFYLNTNIKDIDKVFVKNGILLISDHNFLYGYDISNEHEWKKSERQELRNFAKEKFSEVITPENDSIANSISIIWMEGVFKYFKKTPIKGRLNKIDNIQLYKKNVEDKEIVNILDNLKILKFGNRNIQIIFVEEFYFLLEHFTHENELISVICDEIGNYLYMCFDDGIIEIFRMEIKSINSIIKYSHNLKDKDDIENILGVQNALKGLFEHLKTINVNFNNKSILNPLFENYYHSFSDLNNINWFSQSDIIKKSKFNDIILYHFKYFFNYFNMCFNDFHKYYENSDNFVQPVKKVFGDKEDQKKVESISNDPFKRMQEAMEQESKNQKFFSKENLFGLNLKNFHHFLNNLSLDRFQFLREKFGLIPIYFLFLKSKEEIREKLKSRNFRETDPEVIFQQIFNAFVKDSFSDNLIESIKNEVLYIKMKVLNREISSINYNPQLIFKIDSPWKVEYLSYFFQQFLFENPSPSVHLLSFAKTFNLKIPFIKINLAVQGVSNTITHFLPELDSKVFYLNLMRRNDLLHTTILTTLTSFLLSYPYIAQNVSHAIAFELFHHFIVQRRSEINIFVLVLYFFNDNLLLSASTHFLLNKLSSDKDLYLKKLKISFHIRKKILEIFFRQIKKIKKPDEELSKLELSLLMIILMTLPDSEWSSSNAIKKTIHQFIELVNLKNCITNSFFVISVLKFLIKTISKLVKYVSTSILENLTKNLHYICLYYGLSLDSKHDQISVMHKGMYENKLKYNSKMYNLLQEISYQPLAIRMSLRKHSTKIIKILSDENLTLVLSVFHKLLEDYEHFFFTHINILDLIRYLVRFDDQKLKKRLDLIIQLILKSLDPHKPELRSKCQEYATSTLKSILKRYTFTSFNQHTQHFAVSNHKYYILIYDLKMALEWKVLKGHKQFIDAITIHEDGKYLASFSFLEKRLIIWEIDHQGFFASILHRSNQIVYDVNLDSQIRQKIDLLANVDKLRWDIRFLDHKHFILRERNSKMKITINA